MQNPFSLLSVFLSGPVMVWGVSVIGLLISFGTRFVQIRMFARSVKTVLFGMKKGQNGQISSFQAVTAALSGTIGTGNIAGVAIALAAGGAGAIFWMWISAFLGMAVKFAEITMAVRFRERKDGRFVGGPMYYLTHAVGKRTGKLFAWLCICSSFFVGNMVQANTAFGALLAITPIAPPALMCLFLVLSVVTGIVLAGGMGRIVSVTQVLVPVMAAVYLLGCMAVIVLHPASCLKALCSIVTEAFSFQSMAGGIGGSMLMQAMRVGCTKGVFTNEAGLGSAPIAHAAAECESPAVQGLFGVFEVFFDTIVMCTLTAVVILSSGVPFDSAADGISITLAAFAQTFGQTSRILLGVSVLFFAFAAILSWGGYGDSCILFLNGKRRVRRLYHVLYAAAVFFGAVFPVLSLWELADLFNGLMMIPNLLGLILLLPFVKEETYRLNRPKRKSLYP